MPLFDGSPSLGSGVLAGASSSGHRGVHNPLAHSRSGRGRVLGVLQAPLWAVNLDGARVVEPLTYMPEQHNCPMPCSVDYANVHKELYLGHRSDFC